MAGAVLLGKLNMSEFATGNSVHHPYGTPHNPWDLHRNLGTSSSGSGAATAAFLCATSLGEDTGGSIRNPAHNCGLVGIRPTWGLVSRYGMLGACWSMDIGGPIARTKEEAHQRMAGRRSLTGVCNLANVPALCVPCGFASVAGQDLPIGLQLAGRPCADGLLLRVAHAYEQSTTWHTRRPPIASCSRSNMRESS